MQAKRFLQKGLGVLYSRVFQFAIFSEMTEDTGDKRRHGNAWLPAAL